MKPISQPLIALAFGVALAIAACGGSGSSGGGNPSNDPIGPISDSDNSANTVSESAASGTAVNVTLSAADPNSRDTVSYSLASDAGGLFVVDAATGIVTVAGQLDFEQVASHLIRGRARSSDGTQSEADFTIDVIDDTMELTLATRFPVTNPAAVVHFTGSEIDVAGMVSGPPGDTFEVVVEAGAFSTPAVVDVDGSWRAHDVPLNPDGAGSVRLNVVASSQSGRSAATTFAISTAEMLSSPRAIAIDPARSRAILLDTRLNALISVDLATGQRDTLSGPDRGTGPNLGLVGKLAINSAANAAYVWSRTQFIAIDLTTGDRTALSDSFTGTGPLPQAGYGDIAMDSGTNRLIAIGLDEMIAIDVATGNRTLISGDGRGSGPPFSVPGGVAVLSNNQALVANSGTSVISVDLGSGNRAIVSSNTVGTGPSFKGQVHLIADEQNDRALVVGSELDADLVAVSLSSGNRTELSGNRGTGADIFNPTGITLDMQSNRVLVADEIGKRVTGIDLATGNRSILSGNNVGGGVTWFQISKVILDFDGGRILAGGRNDPFVYSIDLQSGHKSILFDDSDGTGPAVGSFNMAILDQANNRLLACSGIGLFSVDLTSGDRTLISLPDTANGPSLSSITDMTLDSAANRILAVEREDRFNPTVLEIDLLTGLRATVSGLDLGTGPAFDNPQGVILDAPQNRLIVADFASGVLAVDLATGNRRFITDPAATFSAVAVAIDDASRRMFALIRNFDQFELAEVDELTGARTEVSGPNAGSGMPFLNFTDLALDMANNRAFIVHNSGTEILIVDLVSGDRVLFAR